jgi:hypothetical protein
VAEEETYDGIAIPDLRVDSVTWTAGQAEHVRTRSSRYRGAVNLEPEWATEAVMDPKRRFGLAQRARQARESGSSAGPRRPPRCWTVILIPEGHPPTGAWLGVTAWVTKGRDLHDYEAHETGDDAEHEDGGTSR